MFELWVKLMGIAALVQLGVMAGISHKDDSSVSAEGETVSVNK